MASLYSRFFVFTHGRIPSRVLRQHGLSKRDHVTDRSTRSPAIVASLTIDALHECISMDDIEALVEKNYPEWARSRFWAYPLCIEHMDGVSSHGGFDDALQDGSSLLRNTLPTPDECSEILWRTCRISKNMNTSLRRVLPRSALVQGAVECLWLNSVPRIPSRFAMTAERQVSFKSENKALNPVLIPRTALSLAYLGGSEYWENEMEMLCVLLMDFLVLNCTGPKRSAGTQCMTAQHVLDMVQALKITRHWSSCVSLVEHCAIDLVADTNRTTQLLSYSVQNMVHLGHDPLTLTCRLIARMNHCPLDWKTILPLAWSVSVMLERHRTDASLRDVSKELLWMLLYADLDLERVNELWRLHPFLLTMEAFGLLDEMQMQESWERFSDAWDYMQAAAARDWSLSKLRPTVRTCTCMFAVSYGLPCFAFTAYYDADI